MWRDDDERAGDHQRCGVRLGAAVQRAPARDDAGKRDDVELRVFLMGDAVVAAIEGQDLPEGYYHLDRMVRSVGRRGEVGCCGTCMDARGIGDEQLVEEALRSTMDQLADWTLEAERIVTF
jgi:uncharacterized protein involved in oxidation of intracellular sulfur